jgi:lipid A ethanolaminephosphotransferase
MRCQLSRRENRARRSDARGDIRSSLRAVLGRDGAVHPMAFNAILAAYFVLFLNIPLARAVFGVFRAMPDLNAGFALSVPVAFWLAFQLLFGLILFRMTAKPLAIPLVLIGAAASYGTHAYGVIYDTEVIRSLFETDRGEALSYLTPSAAAWFVLLGLLPAVAIWRVRIAQPGVLRGLRARGLVMLCCALGLAGIGALYYANYAAVGRNNRDLKRLVVPVDALDGLYKFAAKSWFARPRPFQHIARDARRVAPRAAPARPRVLVLAVGETARAGNLRYYGYGRDTNPHTRGLGMVRFAATSSCGTATAVSVPCMFSDLRRAGFDRAAASRRDNLLDFLSRAGFRVLWNENDHGCKGVCDRVETRIVSPANAAPCDDGVCRDEAMADIARDLPGPAGPDTVIVLHLSGSHGPTYWRRYPESMRRFVPDCPRADIQHCSNESLVNTYDNTIAYTDYVLARVIGALAARSDLATALVYMSDHGESLGEGGVYLHGWPYLIAPREQTEVPFLAWLSPRFRKQSGLDTGCLSHSADRGPHSHDNLFHSILGLMDVRTAAYRPALDVFSACRIPPLTHLAHNAG